MSRHLVTLFAITFTANAQSTASLACSSTIAPQNAAPSVAPGFRVEVVANNLIRPRSIQFDSEGALLIVEQRQGVRRLRLTGDGTCVRQDGNVENVVDNTNVRTPTASDQCARGVHFSLFDCISC